MKKTLFTWALGLFVAVSTSAMAADTPYTVVEKFPYAEDAKEALQLLDEDRFEGSEDAPIQIIEYASMTCGHCANFHANVYPKLKENYIDTGKVRFTVRPLPWDNRALAVSLVTYCAPREQYKDFVAAYFSTQEQWARSDSFLEDIKKVSRLGGMDGDAVEKCVSDPDVRKVLDYTTKIATETLGVRATPTLFINGNKVEGSMPYAEFANYLDKLLAEKAK